MIPEELKGVLSQDPEVMSGAICFAGTRVPVQALLDTLLHGGNLENFYEGWPGVTPEQAEAVLQWEQNQARRTLGLDLAS
jgi:uncharacterized protein (DUF433 family)